MLTQSKQLGWGTEKQIAEFFGLTKAEVRQLSDSGEWPFVTVYGKRLFNVDELIRILAKQSLPEDSNATEPSHQRKFRESQAVDDTQSDSSATAQNNTNPRCGQPDATPECRVAQIEGVTHAHFQQSDS